MQPTPNQRTTNNIITIKAIIVFVLILAMLIPMIFITSLIPGRLSSRDEAAADIGSKWGKGQIITGPILVVPYDTYTRYKDSIIETTTHFAYKLPEKLNIVGNLDSRKLKRGIFDVVVYNADLKFSGNFGNPSKGEKEYDFTNARWKDAYLIIGISDLRGIRKVVRINMNDSVYEVTSGVPDNPAVKSGLVSKNINVNSDGDNTFEFTLNFNGSEDIYFEPVGKETSVKIKSNWGSPSFTGNFLPDYRNVNPEGFESEWNVQELNRNYPQKWIDNQVKFESSSFGVDLIVPVDSYRKTERAAKYAIMFIGLTFVLFFFVEITSKRRIHPVQYILVGAPLAIFYLLLLSLSEQINFDLSFIIAAIANIILITAYSAGVFKSKKSASWVFVELLMLYSYLYTILQFQDMSLLIGSIGLFLIIVLFMYATRNVDWYGDMKKPAQETVNVEENNSDINN